MALPLLIFFTLSVLLLSPITKAGAQEAEREAERLGDQVIELYQQGRYQEAIPLAERVVEIRRRLLGVDDPNAAERLNNLAASLVNLGSLYRSTLQFDRAEPLLLRAMEIKKRASGPDLDYSKILNNLALLYDDAGRYDKAEPLYLEAAEIRKKSVGPAHHEYATILNNLALLYKSTGRYDKAEPLYLQAIEIWKKLDSESADYATSLNNLALLYASTLRYDKAEPLYLRAADGIRKRLGPDHPFYALSLNNLALLYRNTGRFDRAEMLYLQAIAIGGKLGSEDPGYAASINNLADLYAQTGRYADAEGLYLLAAEIYRKALGPEHPAYAGILENLGLVYQATGRSEEAFSLLTRGMEIEQTNLQRVFAVASESGMRAYLSGAVSTSLNGLIGIAAGQPQGNAAMVETALTWALRRKAIILDTLVRFRRAQLLAQSDPAVAEMGARLRYLRQQMSNLPLNRPGGMSDAGLQQQTREWREESDRLEADLNRRLAAQRPEQPTGAISAPALREKLLAGTALVEFVRSNIYDFKATGQQPRWKPAHYFAFVLTGGAATPARMIDLGEASRINEAISKVRQSIVEFEEDWKAGKIDSNTGPARPNAIKSEKEAEQEYRETSKQLSDLIFAPVRRELGSSNEMIYLAPDDQLSLVPFEALVGADGKYLIENYRFAYLSSGRDLLRAAAKSTAQGTVVFADPDYNLPPAARAQKAKELLAEMTKQPGAAAGGVQAGGSQQASTPYRSAPPREAQGGGRPVRGGLRWERLPASAEEAKAVERELRGTDYGPVKEYLKGEALEEALTRVRSPRVLHISTHGFFPEETGENTTEERPIDPGSGNAAIVGMRLLQRTGNPLLQSGLVLAGANTIGENKTRPLSAEVDDGWVTAEEIALMDLQRTELVVLSACGSGLGAVSAGEGVYGLRRAFQNAGAQTIISTLFEVPDKESGQIMRGFYAGLRNKRGKLEALRDAQLAMIKERRKLEGAAHPFFWAGFVLTGDPH